MPLTKEVVDKVFKEFKGEGDLTDLERNIMEKCINHPEFHKFGAEMFSKQLQAVCDKETYDSLKVGMILRILLEPGQVTAKLLSPFIMAMSIGYRLHEEEILAEVQR